MSDLVIRSAANPRFKQFRKLATHARTRHQAGVTLLDGPHLIAAALDAGARLNELILSEHGLESSEVASLRARCPEVPSWILADGLFGELTDLASPSGILAVWNVPKSTSATAKPTAVLALDGVQDPGNVGTLLRTAAAAGIQEAWLSTDCADPWSPKVLRAGMGAHFALTVRAHTDLVECLSAFQGTVLATALDGAIGLYDLDLRGPSAWVFGSEGAGVSAPVMSVATQKVLIPMPGAVESLNVGAAAAVCLFEQVRQRR